MPLQQSFKDILCSFWDCQVTEINAGNVCQVVFCACVDCYIHLTGNQNLLLFPQHHPSLADVP